MMKKLKFHRTPELMLYAIRAGYVRVTPEDTYRPGFQRKLMGGEAAGGK